MSSRTIQITERLHAYLLDYGVREPEIMQRLRQETATMPAAIMQISPEQGQFMTVLAEILGAHRVIEVGTFTGYSALAVARVLPEDGQLIACDVNAETTAVGKRYWQEAGVAHKIDLRLGPATQTLQHLIDDGLAGRFDMAFIDADKSNYVTYYELCLQLLRPGGVILIDNVLWGGQVADPGVTTQDTLAIRDLNTAVHADERVSMTIVPVGDGLTLARKR